MKNVKLSIYVIMHKYIDLNKYNLDKCYKKLLVGNKFSDQKDIILDSTGDNISQKNKNYCELTGLYWIWKNSSQNIVGLVHYRRFFISNNSLKILKEKEILNILKNYDIILPYKNKIKNIEKTLYDDYGLWHYKTDLDKCRKIISYIYPEYLATFDMVMKDKYFYPYNMFIMNIDKVSLYCKWLFDIFNELEKEIEIDINKRDDYNQRVFGFLSERLFLVWIKKNDLRIHENFVLKTDDKLSKKIKFLIKVILKKMKLI